MKQARRQAAVTKPPRKSACAPCRSRRIRCNKAIPCSNCMIRGLRCQTVKSVTSSSESRPASPETSSASDIGTVIGYPESNTRKAGFQRFVAALDGYLSVIPMPQAVYYWKHGIVPAARSNEPLMNALLCKEIVNKIPKDKLMSTALPAKAIEYYVESLCRPFTKLEDLPLLLMMTFMYIEIEWFLSHYQNMDILMRSALEILYSNREMLWSRYRRDHLFFVLLMELLRLCTETPFDSSPVSLSVWTAIYNLTSKFGAAVDMSGLMLLELRMFDIYFIIQRPDFDNAKFGWKFITFEHSMAQLERTVKPDSNEMKQLINIKGRFRNAKMFWNSYHFHLHGNKFCEDILRVTIEIQMQKLEALGKAKWVETLVDNPLMHFQLFGHVIPRIALTVYYARDQVVCQRIVKLLLVFRSWITWLDDLAAYLRAVACTEFGLHTALDVAYLGPNLPIMLTGWQLVRVVDQVARHGAREILHAGARSFSTVDLID